MNLRRMIYLFSTVWLLVILLMINAAIYFLFYKITTNAELDRLTQQTENIAVSIKPENDVDPADLLWVYLPANGMIRVIDQDGLYPLTTTKNSELIDLPGDFHNSQSANIREMNGETYGVAYLPIIWDNGQVRTLEVTENLQGIKENLNVLKIVLIVAFFIVIIPSFLGGRLLGNIILKPINAMIATMEDIQQSGTFKKIPLRQKHKDELHKMATTFNHMMDILKDNFEKQKQFVYDASHELKTPLTIIESYASMLKRWGMKKPDVLEESVDAIYAEAERMKEMTKQMLLLATNDEDWNLNPSTVNLVNLCEDTCKTFEDVYHREIHIKVLEEQVFAQADEPKLKQVLFILLDNALKYSSKAIDVQVGKEGDHVFFAVEDHGVGIPQDDLGHVFDRFFRVDKARNRKSGGTGLGLSIAKHIVEAHQGSARVESEEGMGTKVTVFLPA